MNNTTNSQDVIMHPSAEATATKSTLGAWLRQQTLATYLLLGGAAVGTGTLQSCTPKEVAPKPVEIDNTKEITEASGTIKYTIAEEPTIIVRPTTYTAASGEIIKTTQDLYLLDSNGDAYKIGVNAEIKLPKTIDINQITSGKIKLLNKNASGEWITVIEQAIPLNFVTNPDLNRDGKIQNDEKFSQLQIKEKVGTSKIDWSKLPSNSGSFIPVIAKEDGEPILDKKVFSLGGVTTKFNNTENYKTELIINNNTQVLASMPLQSAAL